MTEQTTPLDVLEADSINISDALQQLDLRDQLLVLCLYRMEKHLETMSVTLQNWYAEISKFS